MKRTWKHSLAAMLSLLFLVCAGGMIQSVLVEPEPDTAILLGNIIFVLDNYDSRQEVYYDDMEVAVAGFYQGEKKQYMEWARTDSAGYFYICNAPIDGVYSIKGFRFYLSGGGSISMIKDYRKDIDQFHNASWDGIIFSGYPTLFEYKSNNRVVNLRHNLFTIKPTGEVLHLKADQITNYQVGSWGLVLDKPLIFDYFLNDPEFKDSGWLPFIKLEAERYR